jgi:hypothetical protein
LYPLEEVRAASAQLTNKGICFLSIEYLLKLNEMGGQLAAAIFFVAYGIKMRRNVVTSVILLAAALSVYLAWHHFDLASF